MRWIMLILAKLNLYGHAYHWDKDIMLTLFELNLADLTSQREKITLTESYRLDFTMR